MTHKITKISIAAAAAGLINGILGTGGGTVLILLLPVLSSVDEKELFLNSMQIMLPISITSLLINGNTDAMSVLPPYMIGTLLGGIAAGVIQKRIPRFLLHRIFGLITLLGGINKLWTSLFY